MLFLVVGFPFGKSGHTMGSLGLSLTTRDNVS